MGKTSICEPFLSEMIALTDAGKSRPEIAAAVGLPVSSVNAFLDRRGIRPANRRGKKPVFDRAEIQRLIEVERLTQTQVAERLGCGRSAVERVCRKLDLQTSRTGPRTGAGHRDWKGGRIVEKHGYIEIYAPLHPAARKPTGRVFEHRLVMEVALGRYLLPTEVVDHRDDHPRHNWPDNLRLYASNADHLRATITGREKATPRSSIPGAYGSNQKIDRCPSPDETLALCPEHVRRALEHHVAIHRPTPELSALPKSKYLRQGPVETPFPDTSTV